MPAPKVYNAKYHDPWAWSLATAGKTDKEIADAMGITSRTINRWKCEYGMDGKVLLNEDGTKKLSSFGEALCEGKEIADSRVEKSLYELTQGYEYDEREEIITPNKEGVLKRTRVRQTHKHVPANVMAIMYWLNNRSKATGKWAQKQIVSVTTDVDLQSQMKSIADLINAPDEPPRMLPDDE